MKSSCSIHQKLCVVQATANLIIRASVLRQKWRERSHLGFPRHIFTRRTARALREIAIQGEANAADMLKNAMGALAALREEKYDACFGSLARCGEALVFNAAAEVVAAKLLGQPGKEPHAGRD
jgi:hypothetical protein